MLLEIVVGHVFVNRLGHILSKVIGEGANIAVLIYVLGLVECAKNAVLVERVRCFLRPRSLVGD